MYDRKEGGSLKLLLMRHMICMDMILIPNKVAILSSCENIV